MKRIKLKITAKSPLAIAVKKPGSVSECEDYIPGSVIRGAIASHILQLSNQQTPGISEQNLATGGGDFEALFLSDEPAIFQNAYPAVGKFAIKSFLTQKENYDIISQVVEDEVMVLPATAVSSKMESGFKPKDNGVFDTLIDRFCADAYNYPFDPSDPIDPSDPKSLEKKTDVRVEPYSGFYSCKNGKYSSHSVSKRFLTRVGINRQRATSQDDILYGIEVLNESFANNPKGQNWYPVVYRSAIIVNNEELAESLTQFIDKNKNSEIFRLGGATSRGLGKVKIEAEIDNTEKNIESRITEFNEQLKQRWVLWSVFGEPENNLLEDRKYFTLDLQSDAILKDNWRRTTVISPEMLCKFVNLDDEFTNCEEKNDFLKLEVAYSSYNYHSGWNSAWGLMKDIELVTNRGGVYLFSTSQKNEKLWIGKLKELELKGIGDRTSEGFGQVQICNEFHNVFRENAK